jgi:CRISPR-associated protein Cas1
MQQLFNTLYITQFGAYVHLDHETIEVEKNQKTILQIPLVNVGGLALFGNIMVSPALIHSFAESGRNLTWFSRGGRFKARITGGTTGNVLLRCAQHDATGSKLGLEIARNIVAGKISNSRRYIVRCTREIDNAAARDELSAAKERLKASLTELKNAADLDSIRGIEGDAAREYFSAFNNLLKNPTEKITFSGRTRRPPRDPVNAVLSFLYGVLRNDCASALEGVGLDPQVGYLHALRPGRPALALDLMEEFRTIIADRLAVALFNRSQLSEKDFMFRSGGAVELTDKGRKTVISAYYKRKEDQVEHKLLKRSIPLGLIPHAQARLLARTLRGDIPAYPPYQAT